MDHVISRDLKEFLEEKVFIYVKEKRLHSKPREKIERYHRTIKNIVRLEYYYSPEELEAKISEFM